jgi:hypothetical protein
MMPKPDPERNLAARFVPIEKNLASLGFFSPSNKRVRSQKSKTVTVTKTVYGNRVQNRTTIVPGAIYGLPTTADQDKYLALQSIISDTKRRDGQIRNPISFSSAELLSLLHQNQRSGRNYELVGEWLSVMTATTIISEGTVYLAGRKTWATDRFHVFDRVVTFGNEMADGARAEKNHVWLSDWQIENLNNNLLVSVDLERYLSLKNHISRVLVPHLQIWFYASRGAGLFEKSYDELCHLLNLRPYTQPSKIREKLGPSLDELAANGYFKDWRLELTSDHVRYKIVFRHGETLCRQGGGRKDGEEPGKGMADPDKGLQLEKSLVGELVRRGIPENRARKLLSNTAEGQAVLDQLEWGDYWIRQNSCSKIVNPTGFYIYLIRENVGIPETFETSRKKSLRKEEQKARDRQVEEQAAREVEFDRYRTEALDRFISENYSEQEFEALMEIKKHELLPQYRQIGKWKPEILMRFLNSAVRSDLNKRLPLPILDQFIKTQKQAEKRE